MERSHLPSGPPPGTGPGTEPWRPAAAVTIVLRDPGAAAYGRHAAPTSAYGPADVHRLLPVPPAVPRAAVRTSGDPAAAVPSAVPSDGVSDQASDQASDGASDQASDGASDGASDEGPARVTGLLARLRLLPRAA